MALEISKSFVVKASPEAAWNFLTDPARVARCLPGAQITHKVDDQTYAGTITVKVGPVATSYKGTMTFERLDPITRTAAVKATGQDVRGKGGADLRMTSQLLERAPGETEVQITSQVNVMGILAQFGRGMIQDVSDQMFDKFVSAARTELETSMPPQPVSRGVETHPSAPPAERMAAEESPPTAPIEVLSFGSAVAGRAARRAVRRPMMWIGVVILLLAVFWIWSFR
jgi:carbon monoxide dehydrogenase subunit G